MCVCNHGTLKVYRCGVWVTEECPHCPHPLPEPDRRFWQNRLTTKRNGDRIPAVQERPGQPFVKRTNTSDVGELNNQTPMLRTAFGLDAGNLSLGMTPQGFSRQPAPCREAVLIL